MQGNLHTSMQKIATKPDHISHHIQRLTQSVSQT